MKRIFCLVFVFLQIVIFVAASGIYSIVAPGTIQSKTDFAVGVTLHDNPEPATFKLAIEGPSYNDTKLIEVSPSEMKIVNFEVPSIPHGEYNLKVNGVKGLTFENTTKLLYNNRQPKVYIQTDKATYKPGDLVQYRVIVLNEDLRPAKLENSPKLSLKDGAGNLVKQVNDIKLIKGVYSGEFKLSEEPVLGDWTMLFTVDDNENAAQATKQFKVAKYVLPKYSIDIETAADVAYDDPIKITLRAKYTHGKPVKGKASIQIEYFGPSASKKSEKIIEVEGKGHVEFEPVKDLDIEKTDEDDRLWKFTYFPLIKINVFAVMTEDYTGNTFNKSSTINVHKSHYTITVPTAVHSYRANEPFEIKAFVKNLDGSPTQDGKHKAVLMIDKVNRYQIRNKSQDGQYLFQSDLDKNGMALFKVVLPTEERYLRVKVSYGDKYIQLNEISGGTDKEEDTLKKDTIKLVKKTKRPELGKEIVVEVLSETVMPYYNYAIVGRGKILKQEHIQLPENVKSHEIKFTPSFTNVPTSHLYVYYVLNGDLKFGELTLDFNKEFENKIEITAPQEAKPGEEVTLNITTDPDSFVGLLGVDQSVLLLKSGNDFDSNDILNGLDSYNTNTPYVRGFGTYPGKTSGLVTLTNANFPYDMYYYIPYYAALPSPIDFRDIIYYPTAMTAASAMTTANEKQAQFARPSAVNQLIRHKEPIIHFNLPYYRTSPSTIYFRGKVYHSVVMQTNPLMLPEFVNQLIPNKEPIIRKVFTESWIFNDVNNTDANGLTTFTKALPDTITSWVVTGFSINENTGFGMVKSPTTIKTFQPFFMTMNLPYAVKRGEVIAIPIVVFNYMEKALDAEVTMENTDAEYDFTEVSNEIEETILEDKQRVKRILVPSNDGKSLSFMIRPNKVGEITLKIKAVTPLAGDAIHKKLKVEPEGVTQYANEALLLASSATKATKETLKADIPTEAVLNSEYLEFSVAGDTLGPTVKNFDKLVRLPSGCGEQNMINFVPNILVLQYLDTIKSGKPSVVDKAKAFMEIGYQRQLTYKHHNGAYSAFGEGSSEPNSWLTAYVARSFIQAKKYISIDQNVIDEALKYVLSNQLENGNFKQTGRLFTPSQQNDIGFTAFALLALLESAESANKYKSEIDKAIKYIIENIDKETDTYALGISLLVLRKVNHTSADKLMEKLETLAHEENGLKWWSTSSKHNNNIEITAYVLQAYVQSESFAKLLPIIKWLIGQRNNLGGYDSTQDTVVGLQALVGFSEKYFVAGNDIRTVTFTAQDKEGKETTKGSFSIDQDNSMLVQSHVLPKSTRHIILEAEGEGSLLVSLSYHYNLVTTDNKTSFNLKHTILKSNGPNQLKLQICANYVPQADNDIEESNMAVMEIYLPSGFTVDNDELNKLREGKKVQRVETKNDDTAIIIYFDYFVVGEEECVEVSADKTHAVAKQKPAAITVYDYYNSDQRATVYYEVKSSLCDICEKGECGSGCETR